MTVSVNDVERVAELARLELTSTEKENMVRDLNSVLTYFGELSQLDTSSVPPMIQTGEGFLPPAAAQSPVQSLRADEVAPSLDRATVMKAAPDTDGVFFRVPKVIER